MVAGFIFACSPVCSKVGRSAVRCFLGRAFAMIGAACK
jgi:hypothetical protein